MERKRLQQIEGNHALDPELMKLYRDGNGRMPDISRLQIHRNNWLKRLALWLIVVGGLTLGGVWMGNAWLTGGRDQENDSIQITIGAPLELASGDAVTYALTYQNLDRHPLRDVELTLRYPEGFTFREAQPAPGNQYQNTWQLGDLAVNGRGMIRVTGTMVGVVGNIKTLSGTVSYRPDNFNANFLDEFSQSSQITSSILTLKISGPERAVVDRAVEYVVQSANTSDKPYEAVLVQVTYPDGFVFRQSDPNPKPPPPSAGGFTGLVVKQPNSTWYFSRLDGQANATITITGGYPAGNPAAAVREQTFAAQIGFLDETGTLSLQQEQRMTTTLLQPNLQLSAIINGNSTDQPVNFGEVLNYRIVYKNLGQESLSDLTVSANIASKVVDWETLSDKNLGERDGGTIRWDKDSIAGLALVPPLGEGTIDFSIQLKAADALPAESVDFGTVSAISAVIGNVDGLPAQLAVAAIPVTNTVNTSLELRAEGRYFDDDNLAVGSGPLPPVVGEKTMFRIYWSLANSLHEVKDVAITTKLSPDVSWEGKVLSSTGQIGYNETDRVVTWAIANVAPKRTHDDVNGWFDISVTPKSDQVGKLLLLTSETNLTATDGLTNARIVGLKRSITSNLEDDPFGGGRGLVVEIGQ